jgi:predicted peptidase
MLLRSSALAAFGALTAVFAPAPSMPAQSPLPGRQVEQSLRVGDAEVPLLCYLPVGHGEGDTRFPLLLFLHGRGESNGPLAKVATWGPPKYLAAGESLPYVVLSPQCPPKGWWADDTQQQRLVALLDHAERTFRVDRDRVVVAGLSMGGFGTWRLCADHPGRFAAAVPVCGAGDAAWAPKLVSLPIWAWHGTDDRAVPHAGSATMVAAIEQAGGRRVRFTSLAHVGHNSWETAFRTPDLWQWLAAQRRRADESGGASHGK